ncbi:MAG: Dabb family protein [Tannerellaceae bacterium]|nr:Dabb family protein [Tannerellaceae bacterium]
MITHIVMFRLKEFETPQLKTAHMAAIKQSLEGLAGKLPTVLFLSVDFNANPAEKWDVILTSRFDSWESLEAYASHPEHRAVVNEVIAPVCIDRACVDYVSDGRHEDHKL